MADTVSDHSVSGEGREHSRSPGTNLLICTSITPEIFMISTASFLLSSERLIRSERTLCYEISRSDLPRIADNNTPEEQ